MDPRHLDELVRLEETYWWHVAKRQLVIELLQSHCPPSGRLVEGGVGSARNLLAFQELGYEVTGFDIMPEAVEHARNRGLNDVRIHDLTEPWPLESNSARAVVLLDVLEHMPDPVAVLRNIADVLEPGGVLVLTVPAYPLLFGEWDRILGHYRRYTVRELKSQAAQSSLKVSRVAHWNSFTLPPAIIVRGFQRMFPRANAPEFPRVWPITNRMLLTLAHLEKRCLRTVNVPWGLSLVGVLTK